MRHGQAFRPGMDPGKRQHASPLTTSGLAEAQAVAERFVETIEVSGLAAGDVTVACASSLEARATAAELVAQLRRRDAPLVLEALDPSDWPPSWAGEPAPQDDAHERWKKIEAEIVGRLGETTRALVVVGHDPQASWLLHELIGRGRGQRWAGPVPLTRGELAMLGAPPGEELTLRWVLSPSDETSIEQLQAKIRSKMDSAKLLGAFLTGLLVFAGRELAAVTNAPGWFPYTAGLGLVLLATATAAYFVTMFKYDDC